MQERVREQDILNRLEQTLSGMGRLEKLVLGINEHVSLRWHYTVEMIYKCVSARHVIVTCGSKCHLVFLCVCVRMFVSADVIAGNVG